MRIAPPFTLADDVLEKVPCKATGMVSSGIPSLDGVLGGGLTSGRVHEVYSAEADDGAAAIGFAMALASNLSEGGQRPALWLRSASAMRFGGVLQAQGWAEFGGAPEIALFGMVPDGLGLLRAAVDALRCPALSVVIAESWGAMRELDLTASRRLSLAAEKSGVTLLLLRLNAISAPSAAQTRWQVASAPSRALPGHAPGAPVFNITLLRQKSGPCGMDWRLEWDRDRCIFRETPLSGLVLSVPGDRPAAVGTNWQRLGKSAA